MLHIFTFFTDVSRLVYLKKTAEMFDLPINYVVKSQNEYRGFTDKIFMIQEAISALPDNDIVCFMDAYDVLVSGTSDEILQKFLSYNCALLIGAELNSYPEGYDDAYPFTGSKTNYKHVNSGGYCGYKWAIAKMFSWKNANEIVEICRLGGDQHYFIQYYLAHFADFSHNNSGIANIRLDTEAVIFQNMFQTDLSEFKFINGRVVNTALNTYPCILHFNGNSWKLDNGEDIMPVFIDKMNASKNIDLKGIDLKGYSRCTWPNGLVRRSLA